MTAKEFVKERMPNAKVEWYYAFNIKGFREKYWLIRDGNSYMYFAQGDSESNAWVNAKQKLIELEKIKQ